MKSYVTLLLICFVQSPLFADDSERLAGMLASATGNGGLVTIPPGDYYLDGIAPLKINSNSAVSAYGARFHLPKTLRDKARVVAFAGENVSDFRWSGGHFIGHVFDPANSSNLWEPNANTRGILITTTPDGRSENLTFRDITSTGLAGAAITVLGAEKKGSDREIERFARNVTVENCTLERSGKFILSVRMNETQPQNCKRALGNIGGCVMLRCMDRIYLFANF